MHLTNTPTDPRYQQLAPGESGKGAAGSALDGRHSPYGLAIRQAAEQHGVEPQLVEAMIGVESAFDPRAVSRKGARGLMQLMPETAVALGVRNSFNPRQNIEGGVRYLRYLLDRYGGNLPLALAAYNAGPRGVEWHRGIPPYPETWLYVRRVMDLYRNAGGSSLINGGSGLPLGPRLGRPACGGCPLPTAWPTSLGSNYSGAVSQMGVNSQIVYRHADPTGTVTYTNIPPLGAGAPTR